MGCDITYKEADASRRTRKDPEVLSSRERGMPDSAALASVDYLNPLTPQCCDLSVSKLPELSRWMGCNGLSSSMGGEEGRWTATTTALMSCPSSLAAAFVSLALPGNLSHYSFPLFCQLVFSEFSLVSTSFVFSLSACISFSPRMGTRFNPDSWTYQSRTGSRFRVR